MGVSIEGFRGQVITEGDHVYDAARAIWNAADDRRPALIARCASTADVCAAVRYAADRGLPLSVRAGGHNFACTGIVDGGIVVDLRDLRELAVDSRCATATLGAGLTWGDVDAALEREGLITTGGSFSSVGVSGFTLGSGLGWLGRQHGLAGDNVLGAQVVTAEGTVVSAGPDQNPDLYWAVRGGTGNFGVVTRWTMRLFPLSEPLAGTLVYPIDQAPAVLRRLQEAGATAPAAVSWSAALTTAPPDPRLPAELAGRPVLLVPLLFTGAPADGEAALASLLRIGRPAAGGVGPLSYRAFQGLAEDSAPYGMAWDVRAEWLTALDDAAIAHAVAMAQSTPSPLCQVVFRPLGGAIAAPEAPDTPFSFRHAGLLAEVLANAPAGTREPHRAWLSEGLAGLLHVSAGGPDVNHIGLDEEPARVANAFSPPARARLRAVKSAYDPGNTFRSVPYPLA